MPYKIRTSKKKQAIFPVQKLKGRFDHLKEQFSSRLLLMVGVTVMLAVILISIPVYRLFMRQSDDRAWGLEQEASRLFHEKPSSPSDNTATSTKQVETSVERFTKAATLYDDILDRYPNSKAAVIAQFESGNVYAELENYDLAEKRYLAFLKKETHRQELFPLIHLRLAYLYQKQKKDALALDHFKMVYEWEGGLNKDQAGFERGFLLEKIGKNQEAIEIYKKVSGTFMNSPWGTEAKARLAVLEPPKAEQGTSTPLKAAQSMLPPVATATPIPAKFSLPPPPKIAQKVIPPVPTPVAPNPILNPVAVPVPTAPVPPTPATGAGATPSVPIEISPDQLRMLREKGSLTIPLPRQEPKAPPVEGSTPSTPVPEKGVTTPAGVTPTTKAEPTTPPVKLESQKESAPVPISP